MAASTTREWDLLLLGGCQLNRHGSPIALAGREQRLLACLALMGHRPRHFLRGLLWPDSSEKQAAGNIRTTIWRIEHTAPSVLITRAESVELNESVSVDVTRLRTRISRLNEHPHQQWPDSLLDHLSRADLLPGWYDDWVIFDQERLLQVRLDALEHMAERSLTAGNPGRAIAAALTATGIEPLRESAQLLLIKAHLAAGNRTSALRTYHSFVSRLQHELGLRPSRRFTELLSGRLPTS